MLRGKLKREIYAVRHKNIDYRGDGMRGLEGRGEAVALPEVKDAWFQDSVQSGDNRRYRFHCQCRVSLSLLYRSQPLRCATVIKWPVLLSQEGTVTALAFLTLALHQAAGGIRGCTHAPSLVCPPLTLLKSPAVGLKSHR